jgi:hypothetical protein
MRAHRLLRGEWRSLAGLAEPRIAPTVALIQEAISLADAPAQRVVEGADDRRFKTAVVAYDGALEPVVEARSKFDPAPFSLKPSVPLTHAVARVVGLDGVEPFVAVSMYGRIMRGYAQTSVLRAIADLIPLFDGPLPKKRIVLGGDLNVWNNGNGVDATGRRRWAAILDAVESLGFVNLLEKRSVEERRVGRGPMPGCRCAMGDRCYHVETWRAKLGVPGVWCLDYLFATKEMADRLTGPVEVWGELHPEVWDLSDHCPLVARFDL